MKRVIYTCLFGDIDYLPTAPTHLAFANAICFTDNLDREDNGLQLRPLPSYCESHGLFYGMFPGAGGHPSDGCPGAVSHAGRVEYQSYSFWGAVDD